MLKERRETAGMTQQQLANAVQLDRSTISKIESGGLPSIPAAKKIAEILGFDWVLFFDSIENRTTGVPYPAEKGDVVLGQTHDR